jgi:hypothetical protein
MRAQNAQVLELEKGGTAGIWNNRKKAGDLQKRPTGRTSTMKKRRISET